MVPFKRRPRVALTAVALAGLAGCASSLEATRRRLELERLGTFIEQGRPVVLVGMEEQPRMPLLGSRLFRFGGEEPTWPPEQRSPFSTSPAPPALAAAFSARDRRWVVMRAEPGRYRLSHGMLRVTPNGSLPEIGVPLRWESQVVEVPPGIGVAYVGTLRVTCAEGRGRMAMDSECRLEPDLTVEADLARAVAAEHLSKAGDFAVVATLPALPAPAQLRLAPPSGVGDVVAVAPGWRVAVDWTEFSGDAASRDAFRAAGNMMDAAASIGGSGGELGALVAMSFVAAAAISGAVGLAQTGAEQVAQSRAAQEWGDCASRVAAALSPETVTARLRTALPPPATAAAARRRRGEPDATPPASWRLGVTRVVLRRCGGEGTNYGVDVASRWTAWLPGAAEPAYEATVVLPVADAIDDTRQQARRARPWETVLPSNTPCRAFAAYCTPGGEALLTQDVVDGVLAARDAIATAR